MSSKDVKTPCVTALVTNCVTDTSEHDRIAKTLARAFQNEEACSYIFPDPEERARRLIAMFRVIVANDAPAGSIYQTEGGEAITLWRAPGKASGTPWEFTKSLFPFISALGPGIGRGLKIGGLIEKHHPREPFYYLHFAGCAPEHQGNGYGGAAIRAGLAQADADHLPTYLETATERNLGLYRNLGFEVIAEWSVTRALPFWGMLRPAR
jgi:ribosomal protein S18 acetylase RimI-like enzyme